jgi:hypothetical protein
MSLRYMLPRMTDRQTPAKVPAKDAAAMLGVSVRTLDRYQAAGTITPCPVPLRPRMFRVADLEALAEPKPVSA